MTFRILILQQDNAKPTSYVNTLQVAKGYEYIGLCSDSTGAYMLQL